MADFKIGDRVKCLDSGLDINLGRVLEVSDVSPAGYLSFKGLSFGGYSPKSFTLLTRITPHKHAELIKAWADGAEIEVRPPGSRDFYLSCNPCWYDRHEYRIKLVKSDIGIKIDGLEQQAKDLAEEIAKLKAV